MGTMPTLDLRSARRKNRNNRLTDVRVGSLAEVAVGPGNVWLRAKSGSLLPRIAHRAALVASIGETVFLSAISMISAGLTVSHFIEAEFAR